MYRGASVDVPWWHRKQVASERLRMLSGSGAVDPWHDRQGTSWWVECGRAAAAGVVAVWQSRHWSAWIPACPGAV
jgi:hypothetical protein